MLGLCVRVKLACSPAGTDPGCEVSCLVEAGTRLKQSTLGVTRINCFIASLNLEIEKSDSMLQAHELDST
jgi:hypothetical protein